ncbi:MFS transporter [Chloroflexota bacterium]
MKSESKHSKIFYGWVIVAACLLIMLYASGVANFGFTAVFEPIAEEFGWGYAQISFAASLRGLEVGLLAPFMGFMVDRWGPRKLIFGGGIFLSTGFLLLSRVSSLPTFYLSFALVALGMSACTGTIIMTAVSNWFRRKVGLAIGIATSGFALGGLLVPLVTWMIDAFQWRMAMSVAGLGALLIILPLSLLVRHKPEDYGYQPDGETMSNPVDTETILLPAQEVEINLTAKQALGKRAFWHLAISAVCHSFVVGAIITHVMPYLSSLGIARSVSSLLALALPLSSIGGRLSSGWLGDRFSHKKVYTVSFISMTIGSLLFGYITAGNMWLLVPFVITFGLGWGFSVTARLSLQREFFGRASFGTILGFVSGLMMLGNITGAPLAGWMFDTWGSYQRTWLGYSIITALGAILVFTIPALNDRGRLPTLG